MTRFLIALALVLGATSVGLAQSQTGGNFGVPMGGASGFHSGGHYYGHARERTTSPQGQSSEERDATTQSGPPPVARQASTHGK